jgi:hypothetical protein
MRHHLECADISNDFEDAKKLNDVLISKYENLKFKIILILMCQKCFSDKEYYGPVDKYPNIEIHNISSKNPDNNEFDIYMAKIVNRFNEF